MIPLSLYAMAALTALHTHQRPHPFDTHNHRHHHTTTLNTYTSNRATRAMRPRCCAASNPPIDQAPTPRQPAVELLEPADAPSPDIPHEAHAHIELPECKDALRTGRLQADGACRRKHEKPPSLARRLYRGP